MQELTEMQCRLCNTMCIIPQQPPPPLPWRDISPTGSFCTGTSGRLFTVQRWRAVANTLSAEPSKVNISTHRSIGWSSALALLEITREYFFCPKENIGNIGLRPHLLTILAGKHTVNVEYSPLGVDSLTHSLKPYSRLDKRNWQMTKPLATAD